MCVFLHLPILHEDMITCTKFRTNSISDTNRLSQSPFLRESSGAENFVARDLGHLFGFVTQKDDLGRQV